MSNHSKPTFPVHPLYEGTFSVGLDKKFKRIDRDDPPNKGALKLSINPFLIKDIDRNILFDVGLGEFGVDTTTDTIKENLAEHGVADFEVTDIFASHLHWDHIGGLAGRKNGYWELTFPEATLWVSENEWNKLMGLLDKQDEDKADFISFVESKATIQFLGDDEQPLPHVRTKKIGGHTEFSQALFYENGDQKFLMAGDVIGTRGEINRSFAAKYDFDGKQSMKVRDDLKRKAFDEDYGILTYHETHHPIFKLIETDDYKSYTIKNLV